MKKLFMICFAVFSVIMLAGGAALAETAKGVVYEDANQNGQRDNGEPGVSGVLVSNGLDVVKTDANGQYSLPVSDETIIFITKPAGYKVPLNDALLPQYYYIHQPKGSPEEFDFRYAGLAPTGPLPKSVDFGLYKYDEPKTFNFIAFSDTQPFNDAEVDFVRDDVVAELIGVNALFGITMGDLVSDDLAIIPRQNNIIARIGVPWYNVHGNHEMNYRSPNDHYATETFKSIFGPANYSFQYGDAFFIVMDDVDYQGCNMGLDGKPLKDANPTRNGKYQLWIYPEQVAWLKNTLANVPKDKLIVCNTHIQLYSNLTGSSPAYASDAHKEMIKDVLGTLEGRKVLWLAGHTHTTEHHYFNGEQGYNGPAFHEYVLTTVSGSWWSGPKDDRGIPVTPQRDGTPNGYTVFTIDGNNYANRFKAAALPEDYQLAIYLENEIQSWRPNGILYNAPFQTGTRIRTEQLYSTDIVVNVFDGGPKSVTLCAIDGGEPVEMTRMERKDPGYVELYNRLPLDNRGIKKLSDPVPSTHIWQARMPADLDPGVHTVTVKTTDQFGQTFTGHKIFEVYDLGI